MKAMKWSDAHRDIYYYNVKRREWRKISCSLSGAMRCSAPHTLPGGTKFDYNVKETDDLALTADADAVQVDADHQALLDAGYDDPNCWD